jgi:hypothetical protein
MQEGIVGVLTKKKRERNLVTAHTLLLLHSIHFNYSQFLPEVLEFWKRQRLREDLGYLVL